MLSPYRLIFSSSNQTILLITFPKSCNIIDGLQRFVVALLWDTEAFCMHNRATTNLILPAPSFYFLCHMVPSPVENIGNENYTYKQYRHTQ